MGSGPEGPLDGAEVIADFLNVFGALARYRAPTDAEGLYRFPGLLAGQCGLYVKQHRALIQVVAAPRHDGEDRPDRLGVVLADVAQVKIGKTQRHERKR